MVNQEEAKKMNSIGLNRRIQNFIDAKHREMPELRDKDVDELLRDLARESRSTQAL